MNFVLIRKRICLTMWNGFRTIKQHVSLAASRPLFGFFYENLTKRQVAGSSDALMCSFGHVQRLVVFLFNAQTKGGQPC